MSLPRVCIYTAAFGGYDPLRRAVLQSVPADFFCFTDNHGIAAASPWMLRTSWARRNMSARMRAKWFKMHPHLLFPNGALPLATAGRHALPRWRQRYDYTIWIDASLEVVSQDFARDLIAQLDASGLGVFPHPDRSCIFDEAVASTHWAKYKGQKLLEQADSYRNEGYPAGHGLFAAGVVVRDTRAAHLPALDAAWWRENLAWTYQDQLSLPVVWWRAGRRFAVMDQGLWTNPWFRYHKHPREEGILPEYK